MILSSFLLFLLFEPVPVPNHLMFFVLFCFVSKSFFHFCSVFLLLMFLSFSCVARSLLLFELSPRLVFEFILLLLFCCCCFCLVTDFIFSSIVLVLFHFV